MKKIVMKRKQFIRENLALGVGYLLAPSLLGRPNPKSEMTLCGKGDQSKFEIFKLVSSGKIEAPLFIEVNQVVSMDEKLNYHELVDLFPDLSYYKVLLGGTYPKKIMSSGIIIPKGKHETICLHDTILEYSNATILKFSSRYARTAEYNKFTIYGSGGRIECDNNFGYHMIGSNGLEEDVSKYRQETGIAADNEIETSLYRGLDNEPDKSAIMDYCRRSLAHNKIIFLDEGGNFSFEIDRDLS